MKRYFTILAAASILLCGCNAETAEVSALVKTITVSGSAINNNTITATLTYDDQQRLVEYEVSGTEEGSQDAFRTLTQEVTYEEGTITVSGPDMYFKYNLNAEGWPIDCKIRSGVDGEWLQFESYEWSDSYPTLIDNDYFPIREACTWEDGNLTRLDYKGQFAMQTITNYSYQDVAAGCNIPIWMFTYPNDLLTELNLNWFLLPGTLCAKLIYQAEESQYDWDTDDWVPSGKTTYYYDLDKAGRISSIKAVTAIDGDEDASQEQVAFWKFTY